MTPSLSIQARILQGGAGIYEVGNDCYVKLFITEGGRVIVVNHRVIDEDDLLTAYNWGREEALSQQTPYAVDFSEEFIAEGPLPLPVEINNKRVFITDSEGNELQIPEQMAQVYSMVKIVCDGPNCAGDGSGPTKYEWDEHDIQTGKYVLPESFKELLMVQLTDGTKVALCGKGCLSDWVKVIPAVPAPQPANVIKFPVNGKSEA